MSFGVMGCNPKQVWPETPVPGEPLPPPLGTVGESGDRQWQLCKAETDMREGDCVVIYGSFECERMTTNRANGNQAGVVVTPCEDGDAFWVLRKGESMVRTANGTVASDNAQPSGTGGRITSGAGQREIAGISILEANAVANDRLTACSLNWPYVDSR